METENIEEELERIHSLANNGKRLCDVALLKTKFNI